MSRIGKLPIEVPAGVTITVDSSVITVKGPKGELTVPHLSDVTVALEDNKAVVTRKDDERIAKAQHGLQRALLNNAVVGVSEGFTKVLELRGVGYRAEVQGNVLKMALGYSHPVDIPLPVGVTATTVASTPTSENGLLANTITLVSHDKQILGDFAADVKGRRPVEPYKGKGLRYKGEAVKRKVGKQADKKKK